MFSFLAALAAGCGDSASDGNSGVAATGAQGSSSEESRAAVEVPDACTFFAKADLESAVGWELREAEPENVPDGSVCNFDIQRGIDTTRTFPNPALPRSIGFSSVVIGISAADPEAVAEIRQLDPAAFEDVAGLGDDAYYLGPNLLHVRVGDRSFSVRINSDASSEADVAKVRAVILALARSGVSKL
jgi:hypothetical protein